MIIDNLDKFLALPNEMLVEVENLYLPHSCLQRHFDLEPDFPEFLRRLQNSTNLTKINLRDNELNYPTLLTIAQVLLQRSIGGKQIETLNIFDNPGTCSKLFELFSKTNTVIVAEDSPTLPPAVLLPVGWSLPNRYCVAELLEMFAVSEQNLTTTPTLVKFHSHSSTMINKHNKKFTPKTDKKTNLSLPIVIMENGTPVIVPKYLVTPEKTIRSDLNSPLRQIRNQGKRMKLVIKHTTKGIEFAWAHIVLCAVPDFYQLQKEIRFKTNQPVLFRSRSVAYQAPAKRGFEIIEHMYKNYFVSEFQGENDAMDYLEVIAKSTAKIELTDIPTRLMLAVILELICLHNYGILHLDVKLDNIMITNSNPNTATLVDLECSQPMIPINPIQDSSAFGTFIHLAPEVRRGEAKFFVKELDYYSCGTTICSIFASSSLWNKLKTIDSSDIFNSISERFPNRRKELDLMRGLTAENPQERFSIQYAFMELCKEYPDLCKDSIAIKRKNLIDRLRIECTLYAGAEKIIHGALEALTNNDDVTANLNTIFKLQLISYYMNLFRLAVNEPDVNLFQLGVEELLKLKDKPIVECKEYFYFCIPVEHAITKLHNSSNEQVHKRIRSCLGT